MTSIAIDRLTARYRAASSDAPRLRRITDEALARVLEAAVERAGIASDGYLCIRELRASVSLRLRETDATLARQLGEALAQAIGGAVRARSASIIYYSSRAQALVDLAVSALTGNFDRRWAWIQIGIWRTDAAVGAGAVADLVMRALTREPRHALAVVAWLAARRADAFETLVARTSPAVWTGLLRAITGAESALSVDAWATADLRAAPADVEPLLVRSTIAPAVIAAGRDLHVDTARAIAALVLLEVEPAIVHDQTAPQASLRASLAETLAGAFTREPRADVARRGDAERSVAIARESRNADDGEAAIDGGERASTPETATDREADESLPTVRRESPTRHGGLLYLINLAGRIGLPGAILRDARLTARRPRWVLHQLAMALVSAEPSDPAALAFAGLPPDARSPSSLEAAATAIEASAIEDHCAALLDALRAALNRPDDAEVRRRHTEVQCAEAELLRLVCERHARIVADPGWIDVRLSLDDVSPEIRRAGLDVDPGWVPWLGIVVRFVYA